MRVLIAEDNKVNQMVIRKVLQRVLPDSTPDVVNNGKEVCGTWCCVRGHCVYCCGTGAASAGGQVV